MAGFQRKPVEIVAHNIKPTKDKSVLLQTLFKGSTQYLNVDSFFLFPGLAGQTVMDFHAKKQ
jgi:hypothetical protein